MDKLPPNIRAQIEEFKRKADYNSALSKEYRSKYDKTHTPNQPTYEQWLKDNGKQRMAKGGVSKEQRKANLDKFLEGSVAPHKVYHATSGDFKKFLMSKAGKNTKHPTSKLGIFSAENPESTEEFIRSPSKAKGYDLGANVMPLHMSIKKPVEIPSGQFVMQSMALQRMKKKDADKYIKDFMDSARSEGHDGAVIRADKTGRGLAGGNEFTSDNWVAFDPRQVKSAIGNRGTYDPNEHDITKAKGGDVNIKEMRDFIKNKNGIYEGRRFERASDEVPHLLESYSPEALRSLFTGDNARALMTMNPAEFEKYSKEIPEVTARAKFSRGHHDQQFDGTMEDYLKHLAKIKHFDQIPYLGVNKGTAGENQLPWISEHEGRHRSRALANRGHKTSLVEFIPRAELREPFPRRHRDEYIDAIRKEMAISGNRVKPEEMYDENTKENVRRKIIQLPDLYADGGLAKHTKDSKVKHTVYHGTMSGKDFKKFKTPAYFGNKQVANQFSDPEYMYGTSKLEKGEHPHVRPVKLNLKNPKVFTTEEEYEEHVMEGGLDPEHWKKKGHDSVIYAPNGDINHPDAYYVAFHPNQIKSAISHKAEGGAIPRMAEGGGDLHPLVQAAVARGDIHPSEARFFHDMYTTKGDSTKEVANGLSEKQDNYYKRLVSEPELQKNFYGDQKPPKPTPTRSSPANLDLNREQLRAMAMNQYGSPRAQFRMGAQSDANVYPYAGDASYLSELQSASQKDPTYQPYKDEINSILSRNPHLVATNNDISHKAEGGRMDTPSLAQMRMKLTQRNNPDFMDNIGINEAIDMSPKMYLNPDPKSNGFPAIGGVSDRNGLPIGGVDQNNAQVGQQLAPLMPNDPNQQAQQGDQGVQQLGGAGNQTSQAPQNNAPQGQPPPMGNMLSMTPQGQTMNALTPNPSGQGMKKGGTVNPKQMAAIRIKIMMMKGKQKHLAKGGKAEEESHTPTSNPKRVLFSAKGHGDVQGIVVPRHMWEGSEGKGRKVEGMKDINKARAEVYGSEKRPPLTIGQVGKVHKDVLKTHFAKPMDEQIKDEKEALARLRKAKHIGHSSNTLDESEKLDTVRHERDPEGRAYVGYASKGVAGHSLYTSGHGEHEEHHAINTCPGQTVGCGGGHDKHGIIDTSKGTCFAPNAESQYVNAAIRRASHEQAKHDPKMTKDWILAHTHSLRNAANTADKKNLVTLFRPNVVDETDVSSRHVIKGLNKQRKADDKPLIVANSYGKTNELHDPENGYHVTHSNVGPKTKHGSEIAENISRDRQRIRSTIGATDASGRDFVNEEGDKTPPKNSYLVTDVKRNSPLSKLMQKHIKHAKYWSAGREHNEISPEEHEEGEEAHYNGKGEKVPEHKSHYGHMNFEGKRYDYQRQHILHPRLVQVGKNEDGTPHMIPTDSRFKDEEFLPKNRYMTKNGKKAGAILMTTPTESTSNHLHHSSFTHHVSPSHINYAMKNNGEYEIDSPLHQEMSTGKEYVPPQPIKIVRKADGGGIAQMQKTYDDDFNAHPERNFMAQHHLANRMGVKEEQDHHPSLLQRVED